jgi:hypothetical protein
MKNITKTLQNIINKIPIAPLLCLLFFLSLGELFLNEKNSIASLIRVAILASIISSIYILNHKKQIHNQKTIDSSKEQTRHKQQNASIEKNAQIDDFAIILDKNKNNSTAYFIKHEQNLPADLQFLNTISDEIMQRATQEMNEQGFKVKTLKTSFKAPKENPLVHLNTAINKTSTLNEPPSFINMN